MKEIETVVTAIGSIVIATDQSVIEIAIEDIDQDLAITKDAALDLEVAVDIGTVAGNGVDPEVPERTNRAVESRRYTGMYLLRDSNTFLRSSIKLCKVIAFSSYRLAMPLSVDDALSKSDESDRENPPISVTLFRISVF